MNIMITSSNVGESGGFQDQISCWDTTDERHFLCNQNPDSRHHNWQLLQFPRPYPAGFQHVPCLGRWEGCKGHQCTWFSQTRESLGFDNPEWRWLLRMSGVLGKWRGDDILPPSAAGSHDQPAWIQGHGDEAFLSLASTPWFLRPTELQGLQWTSSYSNFLLLIIKIKF